MFHPLAFTKTFAMIGSTLLAVTIVPVLCTWLVRGPFHAEDHNIIMRLLLRLYEPVLDFALRRRRTVLTLAAILLGSAIVVAFGLPKRWVEKLAFAPCSGSSPGWAKEFMPPSTKAAFSTCRPSSPPPRSRR
ncbi:MAG: efflux RND transporter permease subunit [Verrucomicrobiales bacterium]